MKRSYKKLLSNYIPILLFLYGIYEAVVWSVKNTWMEEQILVKGSIITWVEANTNLPILPIQVVIYLGIILFPSIIIIKYGYNSKLDMAFAYIREHDIRIHKYLKRFVFVLLAILALGIAYYTLVVNPV